MIRAAIAGRNRAEANGISVIAAAPVLALCRKLIAAGVDPAEPLEAYRGDVLCLRIRSIGEGASLGVQEEPKLRFRPYQPGRDENGVFDRPREETRVV